MDVDRVMFPAVLPSILEHIADAHFVAFDLELSGIPSQRRHNTDGKQTLAERYEEVKAAAETYHILQVGLTCVEENTENEKYVTRAFNFNLSPLIYEGIDFERSFTYSSGAVDFLLHHNYQMNAPFAVGIPYLSRSEAALAMKSTRMRWDRDAVPDITVRANDTQAVNFMKRVRQEIDAWQETRKSLKADVLSISGQPPPGSSGSDIVIPLNRFEKRLVHQIVRADYPEMQTFGRASSVEIQKKTRRDAEDEQHQKDSLQRRLSSAISGQVGFRWLAEALAGEHGDLSGIDISLCSRDIAGETPAATYDAFLRRFSELRQSLRQRSTVLVGHNCFMDLVFIYKTFYGPLPKTVGEFQVALHKLFPTIIDTKYMATSGSGYAFRSAQLSQIYEALSSENKPSIEPATEYPQYNESESYHQAGFDSLITAKVFLKLAAKLDTQAAQQIPTHEIKPGGTSEPSVVYRNDAKENKSATKAEVAEAKQGEMSVPQNGKKIKKSKKKNRSSPANEVAEGKFFASNNMYEELLKLSDDPISDVAETPTSSSSTLKTGAAEGANEIHVPKLTEAESPTEITPKLGLIPPFQTEFWRVHGNKLRAYGTLEEVCDLTQKLDDKPKVEVEASPQAVEHREERRGSIWDVVRSYIS